MFAAPADTTTAAKSSRPRPEQPERLPEASNPLSQRMTVALDAMGGDGAPGMVVRGASMARERFPIVDFLIYGAESKIRPLIDEMPRLKEACTLHHTDEE